MESKQQLVERLLKPHLYQRWGYTMFDMHGTRGDYKVDLVFKNVTPSGNVNVLRPSSWGPEGLGGFQNKRAMLRKDPQDGELYLWIEDGTGSLSLTLLRPAEYDN